MMPEPFTQPPLAFDDFLSNIDNVAFDDVRQLPHARVASVRDFEAQRAYLRHYYHGMKVHHSARDAAGQVFDYIDARLQPALLHTRGQLADPPPARGERALAPNGFRLPAHEIAPGGVRLVPMRRITLDELSRFQSLEHFFRKSARRQHPPSLAEANANSSASGPPHEYAHAFQTVPNFGGGSTISVWQPDVHGNNIFSLSQQWFSAIGSSGIQTAEVGWQVFPQKYGHTKPVLFTYWTADDYNSTGSYNNDQNQFVQYSATTSPGIAIADISTPGALVEQQISYALYQGNWWLFIGESDSGHAIGYYPGTLYGGGPMASGAQSIDFGGETVGNGDYPPMGSGLLPAAGRGRSASQRNIYYLTNENSPTATDANLTTDNRWRPNYDIVVQTNGAWRTYILFGGPGGGPIAVPSIAPAKPTA